MKLRAKQITTYSAILAVGLVVMFGLLYILIGCRRDWAVISGISIDVLGAILLASPDLGYFKTITYSGELRDIIDSFYRNAKTFTISEDEEWYDTFEREMEDVLFTENIPDDAIFKVETVKNSNLLFYLGCCICKISSQEGAPSPRNRFPAKEIDHVLPRQ